MKRLQSARLILVPLSRVNLGLWLTDVPTLEKKLCCINAVGHMTDEMREIVNVLCETLSYSTESLLWRTFWLIMRRKDQLVVGSAVFKGGPNPEGEVEIGYGLDQNFGGYGYMTEAVGALCVWAMHQPGVYSVVAETALDNVASQNVLTRCGFKLCQNSEAMWWRLT